MAFVGTLLPFSGNVLLILPTQVDPLRMPRPKALEVAAP